MVRRQSDPGYAGYGPASGHFHMGGQTCIYRMAKRALDVTVAVAILAPWAVIVGVVLLVVNPLFNPGPLFFVQTRMGRGGLPFRMIKFRTMCPDHSGARGAWDPLEQQQIPPLGRWLRTRHLDELPQCVNVLRGEMSLIGPRPDAWDHAAAYLHAIPGYRQRHGLRPGISGWAQVQLGYAQGHAAAARKTAIDLAYIRKASLGLDLWLVWRTLCHLLARCRD